MSAVPTKDKATHLRSVLLNMNTCAAEIDSLESTIEASRRRLSEVKKQFDDDSKLVLDYLETMDCKAPGNHGWEARIVFLLRHLTSSGVGQ